MAKNRLTDLRDHLFETIEALKDADKPMDIERARTISLVAQAIIHSAKVEVDMVKAVNGIRPGSAFFGEIREESRALPHIPQREQPRLQAPEPPRSIAKGNGHA